MEPQDIARGLSHGMRACRTGNRLAKPKQPVNRPACLPNTQAAGQSGDPAKALLKIGNDLVRLIQPARLALVLDMQARHFDLAAAGQ